MLAKVRQVFAKLASGSARWLVDWRYASISIKQTKQETKSASFGLQDAQALNNNRRPASKFKIRLVLMAALLLVASLLLSAGQSLIFGVSVFDYILAGIQLVFAVLVGVLMIVARRVNSDKPLPRSITLLALRIARPGLGVFTEIPSANVESSNKVSETQRLIDRASERIQGARN